jgi:hypothetical protein
MRRPRHRGLVTGLVLVMLAAGCGTAEPETPAVVDDPTPTTEEPGPTDDLPEPAEDPAEDPAEEPGATGTALCDAVHHVDELWEAWWEGAFDDGTLILHTDDALDEWPTPDELRAQVEEAAAELSALEDSLSELGEHVDGDVHDVLVRRIVEPQRDLLDFYAESDHDLAAVEDGDTLLARLGELAWVALLGPDLEAEEVAALEGFATLVADECPDLETAVTDVGG